MCCWLSSEYMSNEVDCKGFSLTMTKIRLYLLKFINVNIVNKANVDKKILTSKIWSFPFQTESPTHCPPNNRTPTKNDAQVIVQANKFSKSQTPDPPFNLTTSSNILKSSNNTTPRKGKYFIHTSSIAETFHGKETATGNKTAHSYDKNSQCLHR